MRLLERGNEKCKAALFNAPSTIGSYYTSLVSHDMADGTFYGNKEKYNLQDTRPYKNSYRSPQQLNTAARQTHRQRGETAEIRRAYDRGSLKTDRRFLCPFTGQAAFTAERSFMEFFNSAIDVLQTLVIALGAGLGIWGVINLLEGYGNDNPGAKSQGIKQFMAN